LAPDNSRQALDDLDDLVRLLQQVRSAASRRRWREAFDALDQADETIDQVRYKLLRAVRAEGLWWQQIGELVGLSAQAVQQRYGRLRRRFGHDGSGR
jgi:hypothetical protein